MLLRLATPILLLSSLQGLHVLGASGSLDVALNIGTFRGVAVTAAGTEKWLGIPYAQPPVASLRFKAPLPIQRVFADIQNATAFGAACSQPPNSGLGAPISEDCLFLNVWRPLNTTENMSLPVLVWIHGGSYTTGAASQANFDPTRIIQRSVSIDKPIIFASMNYRLNTFGFLASADVPPRDLNVGLQDQRAALTFIQDNIAAFGGDPSKVTIWGQSAGGGGVESHFVYPPPKPLFRAGIADSSAGPFHNSPDAATFDKPGKPYARLLSQTGCAPGAGSFECLQNLPWETLLNISNAMIDSTLDLQLWEAAVHPDNIISVRASVNILSGNVVHVPYIGGSNLNDGTIFCGSVRGLNLSGVEQDDAFIDFVKQTVIDNSTFTSNVLDEFLALYSANDSSLGAPFNTGDSLFDRAAAWFTDAIYFSPRRFLFQNVASLQPLFGYHFREFIPGNNVIDGVAHGSELSLLFGPVPTSVEVTFADTLLDFYINFINDMNPGPEWAQYTPDSPQVLQLLRNNITMIPDDFNFERIDFMNSAQVHAEFQK